MKAICKPRALVAALGLCSVFLSGAASADYRVTAFGHSSEFEALLAGDVESAKSILGERSLARLDFVEANNLCVTQILAKEFPAAELACATALEKVESEYSMGIVTRKEAKASIYSNLAVALAMSGKIDEAEAALEQALMLNGKDRNAVANYSLLSGSQPSSELAQRF